MNNNELLIETNYRISDDELGLISKLIERKLKIQISSTKYILNPNLIGGLLLVVNDYKIVISSDSLFNLSKEDKFVIESNRVLTDDERSKYESYSNKEFPDSKNIEPQFSINNNIIGGIRIRFKDEEIDLTINKILDKAFSKL